MNLDELNKKFEEETYGELREIEETEKPKKKKKWLLLFLLLIIVFGAVIVISKRWNASNLPDENEIKAAEGAMIDEIPDDMTQGEYGELLQQKIDDSMFTINVRSTPVFKNGTAKGVIDIVNNPSNKFPCKVALTINETDEEVYRCDDLIYPGQYINEIKLTKNLKKGAYPATLTYYVYDEKGEEPIGMIRAGINIAIQN